MTMERTDIVSKRFRFMLGEMMYMTVRGANFCHVRRIRPDVSEMPWATSGTQKWNGASPSFIVKAIVIIIDEVGFVIFMTVH